MATIASFLKLSRSASETVDSGHVPAARAGAVKVPTFLGWTPGLRRPVAARVLACGCHVGVYETRGGAILEILDVRGSTCAHAGHLRNVVLNRERRDDRSSARQSTA